MSCNLNSDIGDRFELLILETAQEQKERRLKEQKEREKRLKEIEDYGRCEGFMYECRNKKGVEWIGAATRYEWDVDKYPLEDPNRKLFLCEQCADEYMEYWNEMWDSYYGACY